LRRSLPKAKSVVSNAITRPLGPTRPAKCSACAPILAPMSNTSDEGSVSWLKAMAMFRSNWQNRCPAKGRGRKRRPASKRYPGPSGRQGLVLTGPDGVEPLQWQFWWPFSSGIQLGCARGHKGFPTPAAQRRLLKASCSAARRAHRPLLPSNGLRFQRHKTSISEGTSPPNSDIRAVRNQGNTGKGAT
jgi:hypothetical protein